MCIYETLGGAKGLHLEREKMSRSHLPSEGLAFRICFKHNNLIAIKVKLIQRWARKLNSHLLKEYTQTSNKAMRITQYYESSEECKSNPQ